MAHYTQFVGNGPVTFHFSGKIMDYSDVRVSNISCCEDRRQRVL